MNKLARIIIVGGGMAVGLAATGVMAVMEKKKRARKKEKTKIQPREITYLKNKLGEA